MYLIWMDDDCIYQGYTEGRVVWNNLFVQLLYYRHCLYPNWRPYIFIRKTHTDWLYIQPITVMTGLLLVASRRRYTTYRLDAISSVRRRRSQCLHECYTRVLALVCRIDATRSHPWVVGHCSRCNRCSQHRSDHSRRRRRQTHLRLCWYCTRPDVTNKEI